MDRVYERRIDQLRRKIQQKITLADDEIARLSSDLLNIQGKIVSTKDRYHNTEQKCKQLKQEILGAEKKEKATVSLIETNKKKKHIKKNRQIQELHAERMKNLQESYKCSIQELENILRKKEQSYFHGFFNRSHGSLDQL